ncbi:MAG TPA: hypothetical protein VMM12_15520 [Longimicrobiales bacterium]|nr:hypothetical protein [Longimicrobiales bacterium]
MLIVVSGPSRAASAARRLESTPPREEESDGDVRDQVLPDDLGEGIVERGDRVFRLQDRNQ